MELKKVCILNLTYRAKTNVKHDGYHSAVKQNRNTERTPAANEAGRWVDAVTAPMFEMLVRIGATTSSHLQQEFL